MNNENRYPVASDHIPEPGQMKRVEAFGERVMIANLAGEYLAVSDTCSHEDASLSLGALKADATVACPLHGSRFCLRTGDALDEPAELPLHTYRVEFEDGTMLLYRDRSG